MGELLSVTDEIPHAQYHLLFGAVEKSGAESH